MSKDCKLLSKKVTITDIDLLFTKAKDKGSRKINFTQFKVAISELAIKEGVELSE